MNADVKERLEYLNDLYVNRYINILDEEKEAKALGDIEGVFTCQAMLRQMSGMIKELFALRKELGFIEEE